MGEMEENDKMLAYGKIAWLWSNSILHKEWPIQLMAQYVLPPVTLGQYCIIEQRGMPVAYCSWAMIDKETENKFILDPSGMRPESWACGDRLWFCDWISPFSPKYTWLLRKAMAKRFPDKVARAIRVKKGSKTAKIAVFAGEGLTKVQSSALRHEYFTDVAKAISENEGLGKDFDLVMN